jgi:hypothetical protein
LGQELDDAQVNKLFGGINGELSIEGSNREGVRSWLEARRGPVSN